VTDVIEIKAIILSRHSGNGSLLAIAKQVHLQRMNLTRRLSAAATFR
jgi:hypothetical protein